MGVDAEVRLERSTSIGPYPDELLGDDIESDHGAREIVELGLIAALMHLPHGSAWRSYYAT